MLHKTRAGFHVHVLMTAIKISFHPMSAPPKNQTSKQHAEMEHRQYFKQKETNKNKNKKANSLLLMWEH
jgi:hypothetical protein